MAEQELSNAARLGELTALLRAALRGIRLDTIEHLVLYEVATNLQPESVERLADVIERARHAGLSGEDLARGRAELIPLPSTGGKHRKEGL